MRFLQGSAVVLALCLLFGTGRATAAVSLGACQASATAANGAGPFTDNTFTVSAGSNQLIVLFFGQANSTATPSATWNGVSLSATGASVTTGALRYDILALKAPATGAQTMSISVSGATSFSDYIICYFNGVSPSTPTQNPTNNSTGANPATTGAIASAAGNETIAGFVSSGAAFSSTSNTNIYNNATNSTAANRVDSTGVSNTMTGSGTTGIATGVDIVAAAGVTGCTVHRLGLLGAGC